MRIDKVLQEERSKLVASLLSENPKLKNVDVKKALQAKYKVGMADPNINRIRSKVIKEAMVKMENKSSIDQKLMEALHKVFNEMHTNSISRLQVVLNPTLGFAIDYDITKKEHRTIGPA